MGPTARKNAVTPLIEMLEDPDAGVRTAAATALGKLGLGEGDLEVMGPLAKAQKVDESPQVRIAAAAAIDQARKGSTASWFPWMLGGAIAAVIAVGVWAWKKLSV
jgi:HEAT repeat protein